MAFPQVRFDDLCVLIPRESHSSTASLPHSATVTRSHSAPLRRRPASLVSDSDEDESHDCLLTIPCLGLRVPCLARKTNKSTHHQHQHRHIVAQQQQPMQSCLSHGRKQPEDSERVIRRSSPALVHVSHSEPSSSSSTLHHRRHHHHHHQSLPAATVPLRDCCPDCVHSVESALLDNYCEKWSSGAVRRRLAPESSSPLRTMREVGCTILANKRRNLLQVGIPSCSLEEDDADLFPLPLPKRSPCVSTTSPVVGGAGGSRSTTPTSTPTTPTRPPSRSRIATTTPTTSRPSTPKIASTTRLLSDSTPPPVRSSIDGLPPRSSVDTLPPPPPPPPLPPRSTKRRAPSDSSSTSSGSSAGLISREVRTRNRSGSTSTNGSRQSSVRLKW